MRDARGRSVVTPVSAVALSAVLTLCACGSDPEAPAEPRRAAEEPPPGRRVTPREEERAREASGKELREAKPLPIPTREGKTRRTPEGPDGPPLEFEGAEPGSPGGQH